MDELERQLTVQINFDEGATYEEVEELRAKVGKLVDEWCCLPTEDPEEPYHRVTAFSSQIAYIDNA